MTHFQVLSEDRDEIVSVLIELFIEKMADFDEIIMKECLENFDKVISENTDEVARFPIFLQSLVHLLFQMHSKYNPGGICNRILGKIKIIAQARLLNLS